MNKFVKFARGMVGVIKGKSRTTLEVTFYNGIKPTTRFIEERATTEITATEFEQTIRKKGATSMLKFLATTVIEPIMWHTDPDEAPQTNRRCLVIVTGGVGPEGRAVWTGLEWRMSDGYRHKKNWITAWAYEPKGPSVKG